MTTKPISKVTTEPNPDTWLRTLDNIEGADLPLVGGKAFRLATLKQNGLNVPPGLVLTTTFFESQIQYAKLTPLWMGSPDIAVTTESLNWLADSLKTKPINKALVKAFEIELVALFDSEIESFAVRSSAIDEDQRDHTFAGIHLTELGVPRHMLPVAITRCWASALSDAALKYRQVHGMSIQGIRIAVLIQPLLRPRSSGVGFTIDPLTGSRDELVVEATWGLGQTLVSGQVQPYYYRLANQPPNYPVLEQQAGSTPPPEGEASSPLAIEDIPRLALQLEQIQAMMGEAQDIEWAQQGDDFFILQTRPIALPQKQAKPLDPEWSRGSHPEYLPELPSPFFSSLLMNSQKQAITFFRELGVAVDDLGPYLKLILGRPYLNLTFLKRIVAQVGIAPGRLLYTIGHTEPGAGGGPLAIDWSRAFKTRYTYWQVFKRLFSSTSLLKQYLALVDEVVQIFDNPQLDGDPALVLSQFRQHHRFYGALFPVNLSLASVLSATTAIGSSLIAPLSQNPATFLTALAQREVRTSDGELTHNLQALGQLVRNDNQTYQYFLQTAGDFADYEQSAAISPQFREGFKALLAQFGERATYEADIGWQRYQEDPAVLLRIIRQYAKSDPNPVPKSNLSWQSLRAQATGLNRLLPWRGWAAKPFVYVLRRFMTMRDELNRARARALAAGRRWDLALGQKWVEQGWLAEPADIFWLTIEEVEQTLIAEQVMGLKIAAIVRARKATYQTYEETPVPFSLQESQIFSIELGHGLTTTVNDDVVTGLPISPGQVRGTIMVLRNPDDFQPGQDDIILVMPTTDPAWLPLLHQATGLVVEMGGLLSHGSVIAREYGVPGVANIPDATQRFQDGDLVLLDGSTGVVQRLGKMS